MVHLKTCFVSMGCFGALGTRKVLQTLVWQTGRWPTGQLLPAQFVTQTMVKGDRVTLMTTGGATVVTGVVESISLLYTTIRSDAFVPISIPNKVPPFYWAAWTCFSSGWLRVQRVQVSGSFVRHHRSQLTASLVARSLPRTRLPLRP